jgi:tetratricopeptide (TPR) repeat protein
MQAVSVKDPGSLDSRRWLAFLEYESKRYGEAVRLFESLRKEYPADREFLDFMADAYLKLGADDKALEVLELSVRLVPDGNAKKSSCQRLAYLYREKGMHGTAADWLIRACGGTPEKAPASDRLLVGELLHRAARPQEAIEWLGTLKKDEKGYFEAQSILAGVYRELGDEDRALATYEKVRLVRPDAGSAHLSAGDIYLERKRLDQAFEAYSRASTCEGTVADGLQGLAEVAYERKNLELAADYYRKALKESPEDRRFLVALREIEEEIAIRAESQAETEHGAAAGDRGAIGTSGAPKRSDAPPAS